MFTTGLLLILNQLISLSLVTGGILAGVFIQLEVLKIKRFDSLNEEWLEFIKKNRAQGGTQHTYDIVIGPVADDNTMQTIQVYISGILTGEEAVKRLRYSKVNNQVSFHTEKALAYLRFIGREKYE